MLFEVINPAGIVVMSMEQKSAIYDKGLLKEIQSAGYIFKIDGKKVSATSTQIDSFVDGVVSSCTPFEYSADIEHNLTEKPVESTVQLKAAIKGTYIVKWAYCKKSKKYDELDNKRKFFDNFDMAQEFLDDRAKKCHPNYWAGGRVEDEDGQPVYIIETN